MTVEAGGGLGYSFEPVLAVFLRVSKRDMRVAIYIVPSAEYKICPFKPVSVLRDCIFLIFYRFARR
jgi:hypothetical protein